MLVCVCCATLFSARQDGWEQRNIACHCWMTEPFQPPPLNAKDQTTDGSQRCVMEVEDVNSGLGQWAVGTCVCICVSFFFFCFNLFSPRVWNLSTQDKWWHFRRGKKWPRAKAASLSTTGLVEF